MLKAGTDEAEERLELGCGRGKVALDEAGQLHARGNQQILQRRQAFHEQRLIFWQLGNNLLQRDVDHPKEGGEEDNHAGDHHQDGGTAGHALALEPAQQGAKRIASVMTRKSGARISAV
jgi:hypothetical protein